MDYAHTPGLLGAIGMLFSEIGVAVVGPASIGEYWLRRGFLQLDEVQPMVLAATH